MTKRELREEYFRKRKELDAVQIELLSGRICDRFAEDFDLARIQVLHTFLPISRNNEPDTLKIIRYIERTAFSIKIAVPKVSESDGDLEHFFLDSATVFSVNKWGIREPVGGHRADVSAIDAILIPLLAFDQTGQRVGYGKGYYDRFIAQCRKDARRIGISFFPPIERIDDVNEFDEPLHYCITPDRTFTF